MPAVRGVSTARSFAIGLTIAAAAIVYGVLGLGSHGLTGDSPSLFYAGDRTLFWLTHRQVHGALNFNGPEPEGFRTDFVRDPEIEDPLHYPVFPALCAALTSWALHDRLGWLNVIDAHHLGLVLMHGFALLVEYLLLERLVGRRAAVSSVIALALFPSAVGHAFNNPKDWPCAQFYACAVLAAGVGLIEQRGRWLLLAGLFTGLALSAKLNGLFALATVALWFPVSYLLLYRRARPLSAGVVAGLLSMPYIAGMTFFVLWPWLYHGELPDWWHHIYEYGRFMLNIGRGTRTTWTDFPLRPILFMTPPLVLGCAAAYLALGWRGGRERAAMWALVVIWLAVPLVRIAAPHSNFLDANRHFIEYVPALSVMAGCGFDAICSWLSGVSARWLRPDAGGRALKQVVYVASVTFVVWPIAEYAPYETTYFNGFIGGLGGAQRTRLFETRDADLRIIGTEGDYWFNSLRQGLSEIRSQMQGLERVGVCGPSRVLARMNWGNSRSPEFVDSWTGDPDRGDFVYVMPRGVFCEPDLVERLKAGRPLVRQIERGGGLIYLVLGPRR